MADYIGTWRHDYESFSFGDWSPSPDRLTSQAKSPQITATIPNAIHSFIGLDSSCAADSTGKA
jgi:hypothetical protein